MNPIQFFLLLLLGKRGLIFYIKIHLIKFGIIKITIIWFFFFIHILLCFTPSPVRGVVCEWMKCRNVSKHSQATS